MVRFGYLVAQAVVPAFLSFIYIFSNHPLYPTFARSHAAIGMRPLNDQQIAGFVSKLSMLLVLLIVGGVVLSRAPLSDEEFARDDPLVWADVERQFERVDRQGHQVRRPGSRGGSDRPRRPIRRPGGPGGDLTDHQHGAATAPEGERPRHRRDRECTAEGSVGLRSMAG